MNENPETSPELLELLQFTSLSLALAVPAELVLADFYTGLEELRQRGSVSLREMARMRAQMGRRPGGNQEEEWAGGYAAGYAAAWAAAILRILDGRDINVPKEIYRAISVCPDPDALTGCLDRAVTVTTAEELFATDLASGA
ncbi:hypothetical protein ACGFNV_24715 [Streptomyces sp. NPDC048751]|uniref:hypothetical protein n=1 Tax=Streptomyces sp. NPDC048751 TaxID=3365591 RepID=UPI0037203C68